MPNLIKSEDHLETLVGSVNKMFLNAANKAVIKNKELALLNIIYKILNNNCYLNTDSNKEERCLVDMYYKLLNRFSFLCKANITRDYSLNNNLNQTYIPTGDYVYTPFDRMFYWQEIDYNTTNSDLVTIADNEGFLTGKSNTSLASFETGIDIDYNNIGRICFLAMESDTVNYEIKDILGNNITAQFNITLLPAINSTLFVSKNIYSHGTINFKIKKL